MTSAMVVERATQRDVEPLPIVASNLRDWLRRTADVVDRMRGGPPARGIARPWPSLRRAVFVLGAPRSGTSLLGDLIGGLPEFSYHYEPPLTKAAARYVYERRWSVRRARLLYRAVYAWLVWRRGEGGRRFVEKTPQNCFVVPFLAGAFPDARFVHIVRDGRDAAASLASKPWLAARGAKSGERESGGYRFGPFARFWVDPARRDEFETTSDLHRCAIAWRRHVESALAGLATLPPERVHEVRYERLVATREEEGERLLDFLAIGDAGSRRSFHAGLAAVHGGSVGRHRGDPREEDGRAIAEMAPLLAQLGYGASAETHA
jgi:hypothetical protein